MITRQVTATEVTMRQLGDVNTAGLPSEEVPLPDGSGAWYITRNVPGFGTLIGGSDPGSTWPEFQVTPEDITGQEWLEYMDHQAL